MAEYTPIWFDDEDVAEWLEDNEDEVRDLSRELLNADDGEIGAIVNRLKSETSTLTDGLNDEILARYSRKQVISDNMPNVIYDALNGTLGIDF